MRLTLRTLLAYRDQVLASKDALDLQEKIEASQNAQKLIERIETVSKRRQMDAPRLDSKTHSGDPNLVAGYLDSSLNQEETVAFERALLESDQSLAEVASCHEILCQVLQHPASVPSRIRERLYRLDRQASTATEFFGKPPNHDDFETQDSAPPLPDATHRPHQEVLPCDDLPEAPDGRHTPPAVNRPSSALPFPPHVAPSPSPSRKVEAGPDGQHRLDTDSPAISARPTSILPPSWVERKKRRRQASALTVTAGLTLATTLLVLALTGTLQTWFKNLIDSSPLEVASTLSEKSEKQLRIDTSQQEEAQVNRDSQEPQRLPVNDESAAPMTSPNIAGDIAGANDSASEPDSSTMRTPTAYDPSLYSPATLLSTGTLVASRTADNMMWNWTNNSPALVPLQVQNLSIFRSHWTLERHPELTLIGTTEARFAPLDGKKISPDIGTSTGLRLHHGKMIIEASGKPGRHLLVQLGEQLLRVTPLDPNSAIGITRSAFLPPGTDRIRGARIWTHQIIGIEGQTEIQGVSRSHLLGPRMATTWKDGGEHHTGPLKTLPDWIAKDKQLDQIAATQLYRQISPGETNVDSLHRLTHHDRIELRIPAAEFLAQLGDTAPLLAAIEEPRNRPNWRIRLLEFVELAMVNSPEFARAWQNQLRSQGEDGELAFELWSGLSQRQLEEGGADLLVSSLDHPNLMIRSLAIRQLMQITGTTELYFPDADADQRFRRVQAWRRRLRDNEIRYVDPPTPPSLDYEL